MSRNNLFLLIACAVAVMIMSSGPMPLGRTGPVTFAERPTLSLDGTRLADNAVPLPSFDHR